ncbi:MAG: CRISPR-associated ring nuclease Crn3/Csx3 [Elusimicrobiota bacterium]|nr:CRISPR-associated ring nuclease Crn3/Csx3 [Elusimicrobiota bacterium]
MDFINFKIHHKDSFVVVEFKLTREIEPSDLLKINPPDAVKEGFASKGVVISGRGPVWLYGFLIHFYHPTKFVAIYDPRVNGAVVVETHIPDVKVGDLIKINL